MRLFSVTSANIAISDIPLKTRFFGLHFVADHFGVIASPKATEFGEKRKITAITPFKVIQGHQVWYQPKAHATSY